jgi:hypothetical protein
VPLQAPDQPAKNEFAAGEALRVTCVPLEKLAAQVLPQLMPAGVLLTVPAPPPEAWTLSWKEPVGRPELLPPPPQPLRIIRNMEVRQQTTTLTLGLGIELPPNLITGPLRWQLLNAGCPLVQIGGESASAMEQVTQKDSGGEASELWKGFSSL